MVDAKKRRTRLSTLLIEGLPYKLNAPGFKQVSRGDGKPVQLYWQAADDAIEAGYPVKSVPLQIGLSDPTAAIAAIEQRCAELQSEMLIWLDGERDDRARLAPTFKGTIETLIDCYMSDEDSAYADVDDETARNYRVWLKMIRNTVGKRALSGIVPKDFRRWYREWKRLAAQSGFEGARTAYGGIQGLRILLNYGIESGIPRCRVLRQDMDRIRFKRGPAREETLSYDEVKKIVSHALKLGMKNFALAQALQFETFLRQKDVIGRFYKVPEDYVLQDGEVLIRGKVWRGLTMDLISLGQDLRIRTSKTGQPVIHKISACELVVSVLGSFSLDEWQGPVACRTDGTPFPDRQSYAKLWRKVAGEVGVGPEKQNRDLRASGISEAAEAGVTDEDIQRQSGHGGKEIVRIAYKRLGLQASERSHEARQKLRRKLEPGVKQDRGEQ